MTTHLILSGGGIKGAFQAGVLSSLQEGIDRGQIETPAEAIGISVGSLNGTLCSIYHDNFRGVESFWRSRVRKPSDLFESKSILFRVIPGLVRSRFDGLMGNKGLQKLIDEVVNVETLRSSPITVRAGSVNVPGKQLVWTTQNDPDFLKYLLASTAIPVIFPTVEISGATHVDGGLISVLPTQESLERKPDRVIAITCSPENLTPTNLDPRDPVQLAEAFMEIITNTILKADIARIRQVNSAIRAVFSRTSAGTQRQLALKEHGLENKKIIETALLSPSKAFDVSTTGKFSSVEISEMIEHGKIVGLEYLMARVMRRTPA